MKKLITIIIAILIMSLLCSCVTTSRDIQNYYVDRENYEAAKFMPDLDNIGEYKDIEYFSRKEQFFFDFCSMQLIAKYDEAEFLKEKERLESAYTYIDKPQRADYVKSSYYTLPVTEFTIAGFDFRVAEFRDTDYPKNFGMVGISDEKQEIAYLWMYAPDLDLICEDDQDPQKEMLEFIDRYFSIK